MNADFIKSAIAGLVGIFAIASNNKLGLGLDTAAQGFIASIVVAFITKEVLNNRAPDSAPATPAAPAVVKAAVVALLLGLALAPRPAAAEGLTAGPSLPMVQVTPGVKDPVALAPGLGISVGGDLFPTTLAGSPVHWLTLAGDVFGNVAGPTAALSVALHVAVLETLTFGFGAKVLSSDGFGALNGKFDHRSVFFLVGLDPTLCYRLVYGHGQSLPAYPATAPAS